MRRDRDTQDSSLRREHEQWLAAARAVLGDDAFAMAFSAGQALSFEEAIVLAAEA